MNLREAAQQALEALEISVRFVYADNRPECEYALAALRAALEQEQSAPFSIEWTPCVKLPVTVYVRAQRPGETHISTREGITPVKPDDLIMRGIDGEEYPIGREIFERTYKIGGEE